MQRIFNPGAHMRQTANAGLKSQAVTPPDQPRQFERMRYALARRSGGTASSLSAAIASASVMVV
jgi:hypothetical protein